jgi:hypothetical protein
MVMVNDSSGGGRRPAGGSGTWSLLKQKIKMADRERENNMDSLQKIIHFVCLEGGGE